MISRLRLSIIFLVCLLSSALCFHTVRADISTGLSARWSFDEGSGTTAADASGNGRTGTLTNSPSWIAGRIGSGALLFDGSDDYVSTSNLTAPSNITLSAWFKTGSSNFNNGQGIIMGRRFSYGLSMTNNGWLNCDFAQAIFSNVHTQTDYAAYNDGNWHHVVCTYDGTTGRLYVDGVLFTGTGSGVAVGTGTGTIYDLPSPTVIGRNGDNNDSYFNGSLDDVRIYTRALSSGDVAELYAYTSGGGVTPPPSNDPPPSSDTIPPAVSSIASSVTSVSATITWTTDESADSQVDYGLSTSYGSQTTLDTSLVTSHSVSLSGLSSNTLYHYRVRSKDATGNSSVSGDKTFTTSAAVVSGGCGSECPTNWKSGIDLTFDGDLNTDYAEEYFYSDALIDDHKVVYIKDSTPILLAHNSRNSISNNEGVSTVVGRYGNNGVQDNVTQCLQNYPNINASTCDDGIIRYRVDRDLQNKYFWGSGISPLYPAYTTPLILGSLKYSPEDPSVSVVGTTGAKPGISITDRSNYYYRGVSDSFGDEWHSLSYADDDQYRQSSYPEQQASDGKTVLFVVNPKTPLISFKAQGANSQFYTTPPKAYFVPVIRDQITYVTGGVDIRLVNIMNANPVYYRIDGGSFIQYSSPINSSNLADGTHTIEYYYNNSFHKTRTIVKNPSYPSSADSFVGGQNTHGYLMWPNDQKFTELRTRLLSGSLATAYSTTRDEHSSFGGTGWDSINNVWHQGLRNGANFALTNALVVAIEGANTRPQHAQYAKKALLDSQLNIDPVGSEVSWLQIPNPSRERFYHGYYAVNVIYDKAFAYDLLVKNYKSSQYSGGITPIEDYKMRDLLAEDNFEMLKVLGGYSCYPTTGQTTSCSLQNSPNVTPSVGMWDFARYSGASIAAMAMPSYDTLYYGTSGYDGTAATRSWAPYPNYPASWKDAFLTYTDKDNSTHVSKVHGYPNQQYMFNHLDGGLIKDQVTAISRTLSNSTRATSAPVGAFDNRIGYYTYSLVGHTMQFLALVNKIKFGTTYPSLEASFQNANNGTEYGLQVNDSDDIDPYHFAQFLLINEYFPGVAAGAQAYLPSAPDQRFQYLTSPYGLIWYNPDWQSSSSGGGQGSSGSLALTTSAASSVTDTTALLRGTITAIGTSNPTSRGFQYGLTTGYGSNTTELGSFSTGAFSKSVSALYCNTLYHYRSYATYSGGTSYGSDATFATAACSGTTTSAGSSSGGGGGINVVPGKGGTVGTSATSNTGASSKTGLILTKNLYVGVTDPEVLALQKYFLSQGLLTATPTGYYGALTETAVKKYQASKGITQTGTIGPVTRASLASGMATTKPAVPAVTSATKSVTTSSIPAFTRDLTLGSSGADVRYLQVFLNAKGYTVATSGNGSKGLEITVFGPATQKALIKFQIAKSITPTTGYFGAKTRAIVNGLR